MKNIGPNLHYHDGMTRGYECHKCFQLALYSHHQTLLGPTFDECYGDIYAGCEHESVERVFPR